MNKEELVKAVATSAKMSQKDTAEIIGAVIETIQKTVAKKQKVTLVGFGTFEARKRAARTGRNPQTGKEIKIAAKTVPAFLQVKSLKKCWQNSLNLFKKELYQRYGSFLLLMFPINLIKEVLSYEVKIGR